MTNMKTLHIMPKVKHFPKDLALVILFTLLCNALIATLFPRKADLDAIERIALCFGLSIAVTPLLDLALNYTPFGIRLSPVLIILSVFTISLAICAYARRSMIPEGDKDFLSTVWGSAPRPCKPSRGLSFSKRKCIDRLLTIILIISIILAISMTVYVIVTPKEGEKFTEFYVLGPNGTASDYPTNLKVGEEGKVMIGIVNHEYANVTYPLEVRLNGDVMDEKSIELTHNETWESPFIFKVKKAGEDQKLEFLLYREGVKEPYCSLHLWVDVKD